MKLKLAVGDAVGVFECTRTGQHLTLTDDQGNTTAVQLIRRDGPVLILQVNGRRVRVYGYANGKQRHVWSNGRHWRYRLLTEGEHAHETDAASLSLNIPAVVTEVLVQPGDAVKLGDTLVLLESMKMVLSIQAPHDGVVKEVFCKVGQSVEPNVRLLALEEPS